MIFLINPDSADREYALKFASARHVIKSQFLSNLSELLSFRSQKDFDVMIQFSLNRKQKTYLKY